MCIWLKQRTERESERVDEGNSGASKIKLGLIGQLTVRLRGRVGVVVQSWAPSFPWLAR